MRKIIIFVLALVISCVSFAFVKSCHNNVKYDDYEFLKECNLKKYEALELHWAYEKAVERLLDKLDSAYDWVDSFDPYDYYEAKYRLDSLYMAEEHNV